MRGEGLPKGDVCRKKGLSSCPRRFSHPRGSSGGSTCSSVCLLTLRHNISLIHFAGMTTFPIILALTTIGCSLSYKRTSQKPSERPGNKLLGPQEQRTGMCGWSHSDKMSPPLPTSVSLFSSLSTTSILIFLPRITIDNFYGWFLSGCLRLFGTTCGLTKWDGMDD